MSSLPESFACPWCGVNYPAKPVLVGKSVRCKGCRNGFILQSDGSATRIEEAPAVVEPAPTPAPVTPAPRPPAKSSERIAKRKSEVLEAARQQMAAQLAEVTQQAANSEAAKAAERKSERLAKAGPAGEGKRASRKAVLTGEGERIGRELRWWWIGLAAALGLVLVLAVLLNLRGSARAAIEDYASPVAADLNRYPQLGLALHARAWLASAPSMPDGPALATDLLDVEIGSERTIAIEPLRAKLGELKGLAYDQGLGMWLSPSDLARARTLTAGRSADLAKRALVTAKIRHVMHAELLAGLELSPDDTVVLTDLLLGTPPRDGEPIAKRMLERGELPDALVLQSFSGRGGWMMIDIGRAPYRAVRGPYRGMLLRFVGAGWPDRWRVLHLQRIVEPAN